MKGRVLFVLGFVVLLLSGCGVNNTTIKTEYYLGENAVIDHYEIELTDSSKLNSYNDKNGSFLKVNYTLTNKSNNNKTVTHSDFKFYNNEEQLISPVTNDEVILKAGETKNLEIIFDVTDKTTMEQYKIIFYSNVVTNNIAFIIEN